MGLNQLTIHDKMLLKWKSILEFGTIEPAISPDIDPLVIPNWLDKDRFLLALKNIQPIRSMIDFSSMSGLLLILQLPLGIVPLIHTGKSESIPNLFLRYLDTGIHVAKWYDGDIFDPESEGHKSIMQVRKMHQYAFSKLSSVPKPEGVTRYDSQFGMILTQWAFVGLILLYPEKCGLHGHDVKILEDINIIWRAFGYVHGVKDEYNMCSESLEETIEMAKIILTETYLPVLRVRPKLNPIGYDMGLDVMLAVKPIVLSKANGAVYLAYWMDVFGLESDRPLTVVESIRFYVFQVTFKYLTRLRSVTDFVRDTTKKRIRHADKNRKKIFEELKGQNPEVKYTMENYDKTACPFGFDYLPKPQNYKLDHLSVDNNNEL